MDKIFSFMVVLFLATVSWGHEVGPDHGEHKSWRDVFPIVEANDAGEVVYDMSRISPFSLTFDHKFFHFERNFSQVTDIISPDIEEEFDLFIFVNLTEKGQGSEDDMVPAQHMQILAKDFRNQIIFTRNASGDIVGFEPDVRGTEGNPPALNNRSGKPDFPVWIPVSSGNGAKEPDPAPYTNTFSGVFRVNHTKSLNRRRQPGMYDSLFVDVIYPWGKPSGIAIHGTPSINDSRLGTRQSHGCVRLSRQYSEALYDFVLSPEMFSEDLVTFPHGERLSPLNTGNGGGYLERPGYKTLIIFFEGF